MYRRRDEESQGDDVVAAALAAVASSRNAESSGPSGSRAKRNASRNPLPLEFCDDNKREAEEVRPVGQERV